jgi:hypothetical protein
MVFLYCSWQLVLLFSFSPWGCLYPSFYIHGSEVTTKVTELVKT